MEYLIGLIAALIGLVGYLFTKKNSAEALLSNTDLNKKLNEQDKQITTDQGLNSVEEQQRREILANLEKSKKDSKNENLDQLNNFFNSDK